MRKYYNWIEKLFNAYDHGLENKIGTKETSTGASSMWKQLNTVFVYRMIKIASEGLIFQT